MLEYFSYLFDKRKLENGDELEIMALSDFPELLLKTINIIKLKPSEKRVIIALNIFLILILHMKIENIILGLVGFLIGYQTYYKYGAGKTGDKVWGMLRYQGIHIHHWVYCLIFLCLQWILLDNNPFIMGLLFGGIIHGIQYSDWDEHVY